MAVLRFKTFVKHPLIFLAVSILFLFLWIFLPRNVLEAQRNGLQCKNEELVTLGEYGRVSAEFCEDILTAHFNRMQIYIGRKVELVLGSKEDISEIGGWVRQCITRGHQCCATPNDNITADTQLEICIDPWNGDVKFTFGNISAPVTMAMEEIQYLTGLMERDMNW